MTGRRASTVCNLVATSVKTTVRPVWFCGTGLGGVGRLVSIHQQNQARVRLSARRESGATMTHGDLNVTAWRNAKTSSQLSAMVANLSAVVCFVFPVFVVFSPSTSTPPSLSLLSLLSPLSYYS